MEEINLDLQKVIEKCKAGEDGIYAVFSDHLSMDANIVMVVKDHELVTPKELKLEIGEDKGHYRSSKGWNNGTIELLMDSNSAYYGSMGFSTGINLLKEMFPGMKAYYCNATHYMFSGRWGRVKEDSYYAKRCDELYDVIGYEENEDLDFVVSK